MAEMQTEVGGAATFRNMAVFLSWTLTSFLCHFCAKAFLTSIKLEIQTEKDPEAGALQFRLNMWGASLVTMVQMVLCLLCVNMKNTKTRNLLTAARITHVLATFATNISMAMMFASSTFAIKLMEPITSAITQYCILGTPMTPVAITSLPIIVGGAIAFSGNPLTDASLTVGVAAAFVSNIILAVRNMAIKQMGEDDKPALTMNIRLSQMPFITSSLLGLAILMLYLEKIGVLPTGAPYVITMCFLSGVFHVAYSFVSTGMVLTQLSVVSHAVANIMKRVLVVLLLYVGGGRRAGMENFLGLMVCVAGLFLYAWDKRPKDAGSSSSSGAKTIPTTSSSLLSSNGRRVRIALATLCLLVFTCGSALYSGGSISPRAIDLLKRTPNGVLSSLTRSTREAATPYVFETIPEWTFGPQSLKRPSWADLEPDLSGYLVNDSLQIADFLQKKLLDKPEESNFLSNKLRTTLEVIKETQRIHYNMFDGILGRYKYCMLIDTADFENKGDPAITAGEIYYLARMGLQIVWYCNTQQCSEKNVDRAAELAKKFSTDDLVVLVHGGGNINHYPEHDKFRFWAMEKFAGYQIFVFPQSIRVEQPDSEHWVKCQQLYCCNRNLTIVLRDLGSLEIARQYFDGGTRLIMAPDMALHIGPVKRSISPAFDIMWVRRSDSEAPYYSDIPPHPPHLRIHISDWIKFRTPMGGPSIERSFNAQLMGLFFVQRGRVVITDRVHGHILATLLDIPHVMLDNEHKKLSNYHRTWNKGLTNVKITDKPAEALAMALELLETYKEVLPPRLPFLQISPSFQKYNWSKPETSYP